MVRGEQHRTEQRVRVCVTPVLLTDAAVWPSLSPVTPVGVLPAASSRASSLDHCRRALWVDFVSRIDRVDFASAISDLLS